MSKRVFKELQKQLLQSVLEGEPTEHLGYEKQEHPNTQGNARNGYSNKIIKDVHGEIGIQIPRDRTSTFDLQVVAKR